MGYYARARNLYRAAGIVIKEHASGLPADRKRLRQLPGIGDYTADALAAIAFGQDVLALEGNLRRVLARLFDLHLDPRTPEGERALRELGEPLLPRGQASAFNQALMDLGAMICTPRNPDCGRCPIQGHCLAFHRGTQRDLPVRAPRKVLPTREAVAGIWRKGRRVLIRRQPEAGLLGGMWGFPGGFLERGESDADGLSRLFNQQLGIKISATSPLPELGHSYTHFKVRLQPYVCQSVGHHR
jgi:A/G-specific adenine glycosylase